MKRLTMGGMAAVAMLVATSAQAVTGVLDFEGFTITYDASGQWDKAPTSYGSSYFYENGHYDPTGEIFTGNGKGLRSYDTLIQFGSSTPARLTSYGGTGNATLESRFSYTIQAKDGWDLVYAQAGQYQYGNFVQLNGGVASAGNTAEVTRTGGRNLPDGSRSGVTVDDTTQGLVSGTWNTWEQRTVAGDSHQIHSTETYDAAGNVTGYDVEHLFVHGPDALEGMRGSFSQTLSAVTNDPRQIAYLDIVSGSLQFNVTAIQTAQSIAPVPEPESYAMLAAGFGAMGLLARRKAKQSA